MDMMKCRYNGIVAERNIEYVCIHSGVQKSASISEHASVWHSFSV